MFVRIRLVRWLFVAAATLLVSCATPPGTEQRPKNIIILFADGVAVTQLEFGRYSSRVLRNAGFAMTDTVFRQGSIGLPDDAIRTRRT